MVDIEINYDKWRTGEGEMSNARAIDSSRTYRRITWRLTIAVWSFRAGAKVITIGRNSGVNVRREKRGRMGKRVLLFLSTCDSRSSGFKRPDLFRNRRTTHTSFIEVDDIRPAIFSVEFTDSFSLSFFLFPLSSVPDCPRRKTIIRNRRVVL